MRHRRRPSILAYATCRHDRRACSVWKLTALSRRLRQAIADDFDLRPVTGRDAWSSRRAAAETGHPPTQLEFFENTHPPRPRRLLLLRATAPTAARPRAACGSTRAMPCSKAATPARRLCPATRRACSSRRCATRTRNCRCRPKRRKASRRTDRRPRSLGEDGRARSAHG